MTSTTGNPRRLRLPSDISWSDAAAGLLGVVLLGLVAYPVSRVLGRAFLGEAGSEGSAFAGAAEQPDIVAVIGQTILVVVLAGIVALIVGSGLAYLHERTDARMPLFGDVLPLVPFLIPPIAGSIGWIILLSPRAGYLNGWIRDALAVVGVEYGSGRTPERPLDIYSWYGLVFVYAVYMVPFVFLVVSAALRNFDPSLEEQSHVCGGSRLQTLRKVVLPAIRPSMAAAGCCWSGSGWPCTRSPRRSVPGSASRCSPYASSTCSPSRHHRRPRWPWCSA